MIAWVGFWVSSGPWLDLGDNADFWASKSVMDLDWIWMIRLFSEHLLISMVGFWVSSGPWLNLDDKAVFTTYWRSRSSLFHSTQLNILCKKNMKSFIPKNHWFRMLWLALTVEFGVWLFRSIFNFTSMDRKIILSSREIIVLTNAVLLSHNLVNSKENESKERPTEIQNRP